MSVFVCFNPAVSRTAEKLVARLAEAEVLCLAGQKLGDNWRVAANPNLRWDCETWRDFWSGQAQRVDAAIVVVVVATPDAAITEDMDRGNVSPRALSVHAQRAGKPVWFVAIDCNGQVVRQAGRKVVLGRIPRPCVATHEG
jgi:hypothetical protein